MNLSSNRRPSFLFFFPLGMALFFYLFSDVCVPFVTGFILAYLFVPVINRVSRYVSRSLICALLSILFVSLVIVSVVMIIPTLKEYVVKLTGNLPTYYDNFVEFFNQSFDMQEISSYKDEINELKESLKQEAQQYAHQKISIVTSILSGLASQRNKIFGFFSALVIVPISFFYFARDWDRFTGKIYDFIPVRQHQFIHEIFYVVRRASLKFFRAQFVVVAILSTYYSSLLSVIQIDHPLIFGAISGLLSFIPFIGAMLSLFIVIFFSIGCLTVTKFYLLIVTYFVGQFLEGYILSPKFVGNSTGLHPLWIFFAFFGGFSLAGTMGVLLAIPIITIIQELLDFYVTKFKASQVYKQ